MGLKYASVRHPYVVVMAPALTETSQPQGLSLKSGAVSSPVSLLTLNESAKNKSKYEIQCSKHLKALDDSLPMNGDSVNNKELTTTSLSPLSSCDDGRKSKSYLNTSEFPEQSIVKESDYSLLQIGGFMMNNSYSGAGDDDNMGLQKSDSQVSNMDSSNYLKMDLFKNLEGGSLPQNDLGGGGDLGHNVDEIMQVIKNMESKGNDIEENLGLQINDGNDIAGSLSTFEREFFNDVDMMNMCVEENLGDNNLAIVNKDTLIKEKVDETQERQFKLERKLEWLIRKLRKTQARAMGKQASEIITGMLQHVNNSSADGSNSCKNLALYSVLVSGKGDNEKTKEVSSLSTLVRRLDQSSQQQALVASQNRVSCKYFGSGSNENSSSRQCYTALSGSILPKLSSDVRKDVENVSGQLHFQLKVVETGIDSDVTASSSGGESCDEMQSFNCSQPQSLPISKRAAWKWLHDRAAIASRWSWLQAQISDLEYRIRQNNEVNKQIRTGKGRVALAGDDPPRLSDSVIVNGYHGSLPGTTGKVGDEEIVPESACRTRPLLRSSFRKRKLLHTAGLHLTSKKAAKPSTVQCGCHLPLTSCTLCTGRPNPTLPRPDNDLLTVNERIALLDPAFHPVLSLPCDVSQSQHFDALMKTCDWQIKAQRLQLKTSNVLRVLDQPCSEEHVPVESKPLQHRRRYFKRSAATSLSERIPADDRGLESRHTEEEAESTTSSFTVVSGVSRPSPVPSPSPGGPHSSKERDAFRRKRENSYDIDNIVIPYSVAASTRLEKLQYKEILTPKWRVLPLEPIVKIEGKNNGLIRRISQEDGDAEDLSDEVLISRHERSEQLEKKKFSTYLKLPNSLSRPRGQRRADSRAESSGGNTPDPMSPAGADGGGSPMTSPPATPQPADPEVAIRRRTISSRCVSPVEPVHDEVPPYELRTFPLTDETYEKMLRVMPPGHPFKVNSSSHPSSHDSECESRPTTPLSDSTESADTFVEEDPNDPEWTVDETSLERVPCKR